MKRALILFVVIFSVPTRSFADTQIDRHGNFIDIYDSSGGYTGCQQMGNSIYCDDPVKSGGTSLEAMTRLGYRPVQSSGDQAAKFIGGVLSDVLDQRANAASQPLELQSDAKIAPGYSFVSTKVFIADDGNLDSLIAYSHLIPLLQQKGYEFVLMKADADLACWAGIKNQATAGYMTLNLYCFQANSQQLIVDAFAAKRIDRYDQAELIKILSYEVAKRLPNVRR